MISASHAKQQQKKPVIRVQIAEDEIHNDLKLRLSFPAGAFYFILK